ncbi:MAG: hypothetical protein HY663_03520, partial [Chloroflexi bacterium]|nr:hypothetical protein [Chloroflexota bacterium]
MEEDALFSSDPRIRWEYSKQWAPSYSKKLLADLKMMRLHKISSQDIDPLNALPNQYQGKVKNWGEHFSLYGSLNAWMVFVGPSPGNSPARGKIDELLDSAFHHRNPVLGWPHPSLYYPDTRGFLDKIRDWACMAYNYGDIFNK